MNPYKKPTADAKRLPALLEAGGTQSIIVTRIVGDRRNRRNKVGKTWEHYRSMEDRSEAERRYIKAYYDNIRVRKRVLAKYQARPFLKPALKKASAKLLKILKRGIVK